MKQDTYINKNKHKENPIKNFNYRKNNLFLGVALYFRFEKAFQIRLKPIFVLIDKGLTH